MNPLISIFTFFLIISLAFAQTDAIFLPAGKPNENNSTQF